MNCRHCGVAFDATPYQIRKSDFQCIPCRREMHRQWRLKRKQDGRPVVSTKMPRDYHRAYESSYYQDDKNRERRNELMREYAKSHKTEHHHKARRLVRSAIKSGRLVKMPCEVCGEKRVHAHHDDYDKPLDVRWLCPKHHYEHHAKAKGEKA